MMDHVAATWKWFVANASTPGRWGYTSLEPAEREHLTRCGVDREYSWLPEIGTIDDYGNSINPNVTTPAIKADVWRCNCGQMGSDHLKVAKSLELFVPGPRSLGDIIAEVVKAGEQDEQPKAASGESFTAQQIADYIVNPTTLNHIVETGSDDDGRCRASALRRAAREEGLNADVKRRRLFGEEYWMVEIRGNASAVARIVLAYERANPAN